MPTKYKNVVLFLRNQAFCWYYLVCKDQTRTHLDPRESFFPAHKLRFIGINDIRGAALMAFLW